MADCVALIVASGRGQRFGAERPKQYQPLAGRAVLRHCLERFCRHPRVGRVRAVIHPEDRALYDQAALGLELLSPAEGGPTRQDSVRLGLESLGATPPDVVLIHDGVRPLLDAALIDRVLDGLARKRRGAARPAGDRYPEAGRGRSRARHGRARRPLPRTNAAGLRLPRRFWRPTGPRIGRRSGPR